MRCIIRPFERRSKFYRVNAFIRCRKNRCTCADTCVRAIVTSRLESTVEWCFMRVMKTGIHAWTRTHIYTPVRACKWVSEFTPSHYMALLYGSYADNTVGEPSPPVHWWITMLRTWLQIDSISLKYCKEENRDWDICRRSDQYAE